MTIPGNSWLLSTKNLVNLWKKIFDMFFKRRRDTRDNDIQHKGTQHNDIQHNNTKKRDTQHDGIEHNSIVLMLNVTYKPALLNVVMLSVVAPLKQSVSLLKLNCTKIDWLPMKN